MMMMITMMMMMMMMKCFNSCKNNDCFTELLKIAEFFFAIPSHSANIERMFSVMQSQWTTEREKN